MEFICNPDYLKDELTLLLKLFDLDINISNTQKPKYYVSKVTFNLLDQTANITITKSKNLKNSISKSKEDTFIYNNIKFDLSLKKDTMRFAKICLYKALSRSLHSTLTWGSLTGIRPTKIFKELVQEYICNNPNFDIEHALNFAVAEIQNRYFVSKAKASILKDIYLTQKEYLPSNKKVHLYINIPFCPTRCEYCSFVACGIDKFSNLLPPYLDALIFDVEKTIEFLIKNNYTIDTIYIGGGTPTTLTPSELNRLLTSLDSLKIKEKTVEAGRPDTITKEKLKVLKEHNISRISINPQSFCLDTLKAIGRHHTIDDIYNAFNLQKEFNFDVNMDLIAGLNGEKFKTFKHSLNECIRLNPTDITVHTLSIKNTSNLKLYGGKMASKHDVTKMINYAYLRLTKLGYHPYYLYRQKNMIGNHENIGYTKDFSCMFNVVSMEETASIVACGANGISKKLDLDTNKIERFANVKNINEYISRVEDIVTKKLDFFKN